MNVNCLNMIKESNNLTWVITGCAGFIGSNLLKFLLANEQKVIGIDNFSTGSKNNLKLVEEFVSQKRWNNFNFFESSLSTVDECNSIIAGADVILHQAALGSIPRSIKNPIDSHNSNVNSFLNILFSAKEFEIKKFIYASSSSVYGDNIELPKIEQNFGNPLSPYALTKRINEMTADVFFKTYEFNSIGLRYFNVFGPMQNPAGEYAAVVPKWIQAMINDLEVSINGDGLTSRDFCYVENVVEANILAALTDNQPGAHTYNVALGDTTNLNELFNYIKQILLDNGIRYSKEPNYLNFRKGDIKNSLADISAIHNDLSYSASYSIYEGLKKTIPYYINDNV